MRSKRMSQITAAIDFNQRFVTPWLLEFKRLHPAVDVELSLSSRNVELIASGTDVATELST